MCCMNDGFSTLASKQDLFFLKQHLGHRRFLINFAKFLTITFFYITPPMAALYGRACAGQLGLEIE